MICTAKPFKIHAEMYKKVLTKIMMMTYENLEY